MEGTELEAFCFARHYGSRGPVKGKTDVHSPWPRRPEPRARNPGTAPEAADHP